MRSWALHRGLQEFKRTDRRADPKRETTEVCKKKKRHVRTTKTRLTNKIRREAQRRGKVTRSFKKHYKGNKDD